MDKQFETIIKEKESGRELYIGQFDTLAEYMGHTNGQKRAIKQAIGAPRKPYPKTFQITDMCEQVLDGKPVKEVYEGIMEEYPDLNFKKSRHYRNNNVGQSVTLLLDREDVQTYISEGLISKRDLFACNTASTLVRLLEKTKKRYDDMMAERLQREIDRQKSIQGVYQETAEMVDALIAVGQLTKNQREKTLGRMLLRAGATVSEVAEMLSRSKSVVRKWNYEINQ